MYSNNLKSLVSCTKRITDYDNYGPLSGCFSLTGKEAWVKTLCVNLPTIFICEQRVTHVKSNFYRW